MMQKILVSLAMLALVACSQKSDPAVAASDSSGAGTAAAEAPAAAGDACSLVANPEATFGQPVTGSTRTDFNGTRSCDWKSPEGRLCGTLTVFGPGYNAVPDVKANYVGMTTSLKAFGETQDVAGVGEEAKAVDGGILGAQLAFRTGTHLALAASACSSGDDKAPALAEKLAREVAPKL